MIDTPWLRRCWQRRYGFAVWSVSISALIAMGAILKMRCVAGAGNHSDLVTRGAALFTKPFTPEEGLGPRFNQTSCVACHSISSGQPSPTGLATSIRIARMTAFGFDPMIRRGGPVARLHSTTDEICCEAWVGIPLDANLTSVRNAPPLHGVGLINAIADDEIVSRAVIQLDGIHGRANWVRTLDGALHVGRFGWKADVADLKQFVGEALRNELGITNPLAPKDLVDRRKERNHCCPGDNLDPDDDGTMLSALTGFVVTLPAPVTEKIDWEGAAVFTRIRCDACHSPNLHLGDRRIRLYSDLLIHDLGVELDDSFVQGQARGSDWRTAPLWGLRERVRFLHDGRAQSISEAILLHGGEAATAKKRFQDLTDKDRLALLKFLGGL